MTTHSPRYTARPSRSRITLARVSAWIDRHDVALAWLTLCAFSVAFSVVFTYALTLDAPSLAWITEHRALAFVGIAFAFVAFAFVVGAFVHLITQDTSARAHARAHSRTLARVNYEHTRETLALMRRLNDMTQERNDAQRDARRNAYALLTELERHDN